MLQISYSGIATTELPLYDLSMSLVVVCESERGPWQVEFLEHRHKELGLNVLRAGIWSSS